MKNLIDTGSPQYLRRLVGEINTALANNHPVWVVCGPGTVRARSVAYRRETNRITVTDKFGVTTQHGPNDFYNSYNQKTISASRTP